MKLRKIKVFLLIFGIILGNVFLNIVKAEIPSVSSKAACLIIADSGEVLFAKNENEKLPMASTTKIMTALLTLESIDACGNNEIEITDEMVRVEGTSMGLMPKDIVSLESLAKGMLLCSGNDAANAAAIAVGGDKDRFIELMNERAKQIGMKNTRFVTPSGLDSGDHHSTAHDMAILGAFAMENQRFSAIASKKSDKVTFINPQKTVTYKNHNKLLRLYDGCIGVKTGFTKAAGRCLVSSAQRNGVKLVAVTLNAPNDWDDHKKMFDYGFENTVSKDFNDRNLKITIPIYGGDINQIEATCVSSFSYAFKKGDESKVRRAVDVPENIEAPIEKGQILGKVIYYLDAKEIGRNEIISECSVAKTKDERNIWQKIADFFLKMFGRK